MPQPLTQCEHTKANGQRCQQVRGLTMKDGKVSCAFHAGKTDMKKIRAEGGGRTDQSPEAALNHPDEEIRELARKELRRLLKDDNANVRIRAATALAAYSPEKPVNEAEKRGWQTDYAGVPTAELIRILKASGEPVSILPSPGEVLPARPNRSPGSVPATSGA